ncbi:hypothetical protein JQK62_19840, partial [Leptospira santarosai]|nr:hypothetical protein [Leptospira santarosai]
MKKVLFTFILVLLTAALAACGGSDKESKGNADNDKTVTLGGSAGPYSDMLNKAIKPALEEKGYKVKITLLVFFFKHLLTPFNSLRISHRP